MSIITDRVNHEHYKDLLRTAEQYRLEREALDALPKKLNILRRAMTWLSSSVTILIKQLRLRSQGLHYHHHHEVIKTQR